MKTDRTGVGLALLSVREGRARSASINPFRGQTGSVPPPTPDLLYLHEGLQLFVPTVAAFIQSTAASLVCSGVGGKWAVSTDAAWETG